MDQLTVPLVASLGTRDTTLAKDGLMKNCFMEKTGQEVYAKKRPGLQLLTSFTGPNALCQGSFAIAGVLYGIWNEKVYNTVTGVSYTIPVVTTGSWPDLLGEQYSILQNTQQAYVVMQNRGALYKFDGATFTRVVPQSTGVTAGDTMTPGIVELDSTYYVLTVSGTLYGSALGDPTTWPALNYNLPTVQLGQGMAINRHLSYIQCMYSRGTILFYDAGNYPGLPALPVQNGISQIGCAAGRTVVEVEDTTVFMSYSPQSGRGIYSMTGLGMQKISTAQIDRLIENPALNLSTFCFGLQSSGHKFYVLTLTYLQLTLVYDLTTQEWAQWTQVFGGVELPFGGTAPAQIGSQQFLFDANNGEIYQLVSTAYQDRGEQILMMVRTPRYDWGTYHRKFLGATMLKADTIADTLTIQWSDDDYQTWSGAQTVDLSKDRKQVLRCGSTVGRSWRITYGGNNPLRLFSLLPEVTSVET